MTDEESIDGLIEGLTDAGYTHRTTLTSKLSGPTTADTTRLGTFTADGRVCVLDVDESDPSPVPGFVAEDPTDICFGRGEQLYVLDGSAIVPLITSSGPIGVRWDQWSNLRRIDAFDGEPSLAALTEQGDVLLLSAQDGRERTRIEQRLGSSIHGEHLLTHRERVFTAVGETLTCHDYRGNFEFDVALSAPAVAMAVLNSRVVVACANDHVYWYDFDGDERASVDETIDTLEAVGTSMVLGKRDRSLVACGKGGTVEPLTEIGTREMAHTVDGKRLLLLGDQSALFEYDATPQTKVLADSVAVGTGEIAVELVNPHPIPHDFSVALSAADVDAESASQYNVTVAPATTEEVEFPLGEFASDPGTLLVETQSSEGQEEVSVPVVSQRVHDTELPLSRLERPTDDGELSSPDSTTNPQQETVDRGDRSNRPPVRSGSLSDPRLQKGAEDTETSESEADGSEADGTEVGPTPSGDAEADETVTDSHHGRETVGGETESWGREESSSPFEFTEPSSEASPTEVAETADSGERVAEPEAAAGHADDPGDTDEQSGQRSAAAGSSPSPGDGKTPTESLNEPPVEKIDVNIDLVTVENGRGVAEVTLRNHTPAEFEDVSLPDCPRNVQLDTDLPTVLPAGRTASFRIAGPLSAVGEFAVSPRIRGFEVGTATLELPEEVLRIELKDHGEDAAGLSVQNKLDVPVTDTVRLSVTRPDGDKVEEWSYKTTFRPGRTNVQLPVAPLVERGASVVTISILGVDTRSEVSLDRFTPFSSVNCTNQMLCQSQDDENGEIRVHNEQYASESESRFTGPVVDIVEIENGRSEPLEAVQVLDFRNPAGLSPTFDIPASETRRIARLCDFSGADSTVPAIGVEANDGRHLDQRGSKPIRTASKVIDARVRIQPFDEDSVLVSLAIDAELPRSVDSLRLTTFRITKGPVSIRLYPKLEVETGRTYTTHVVSADVSSLRGQHPRVDLTFADGSREISDVTTVADLVPEPFRGPPVELERVTRGESQEDLTIAVRTQSDCSAVTVQEVTVLVDDGTVTPRQSDDAEGKRRFDVSVPSADRGEIPVELVYERRTGPKETAQYLVRTTEPGDVELVAGDVPMSEFFGEGWPTPLCSYWSVLDPDRTRR